MCIYTIASCKVFTIRCLIREWLKFVQIRLVMRKESLKRIISSFWVQYLHFEVWMIETRSLSIELDNRCKKNASFHKFEYVVCIYTNARCRVFTIRDVIREWLKFVQIRCVMRKEELKRILSSFWVQYLYFELWMVVSRSIYIELDNRCVKSPPFIVLNTKCAFIRTRDI